MYLRKSSRFNENGNHHESLDFYISGLRIEISIPDLRKSVLVVCSHKHKYLTFLLECLPDKVLSSNVDRYSNVDLLNMNCH